MTSLQIVPASGFEPEPKPWSECAEEFVMQFGGKYGEVVDTRWEKWLGSHALNVATRNPDIHLNGPDCLIVPATKRVAYAVDTKTHDPLKGSRYPVFCVSDGALETLESVQEHNGFIGVFAFVQTDYSDPLVAFPAQIRMHGIRRRGQDGWYREINTHWAGLGPLSWLLGEMMPHSGEAA